MQTRPYMTLLLAGATLVLVPPALADDPPAIEQLQKQMAEMEAQMNNLRQRLGEERMTEQRADAIRDLVYDVLADADMRASLLDNGLHAGWDKGFFLADANGDFMLKIGGQIHARAVFNLQDDDPGIDTTRYGFEIRRAKVAFSGHVYENWKYYVNGAFDRGGGSFKLEDAWIQHQIGDTNWHIKVGQFKGPFMREELVSSKRQLTVDRSLVNEAFNQDRTQGIQLEYKGEKAIVKLSYNDGFGTKNTPALKYDTEFSAGGRAEVLLAGDWSQFKDFTSFDGEEFAAMIGGAVHWEKMEYGTAAGPEESFITWTIDGSVEFGGANLFVAAVGRHLDEAGADQYGFVAQGGYFFNENWEGFARYEWSDADMMGVDDLNVLTIGVNRYYHKHNVKMTTDIGYAFDSIDPYFASSGVGYRSDAPGNDGQLVIRSQIQLLF